MHAWKFLLKVKLSYNLFSYKNNQNQTEHLSQNQDSFLVKLSRLKFKCFYWSKRYNLESQSETFDRCSLVFRLMRHESCQSTQHLSIQHNFIALQAAFQRVTPSFHLIMNLMQFISKTNLSWIFVIF